MSYRPGSKVALLRHRSEFPSPWQPIETRTLVVVILALVHFEHEVLRLCLMPGVGFSAAVSYDCAAVRAAQVGSSALKAGLAEAT